MKVWRFRGPFSNHGYAYVRASLCERRVLDKQIAAGQRPGLQSLRDFEREFKQRAPGPRSYRANYILTVRKRAALKATGEPQP